MSNTILTQKLRISVNGSSMPQAVHFSLITDSATAFTVASLDTLSVYGKAGEQILITLDDAVLFTGEILNVSRVGQYQRHTLSDGCNRLCVHCILPAYRKESASRILSDILDTAGIDTKVMTVPDVVLSRFSSPRISCYTAIVQLVEALGEYGHTDIRFFFDAENRLRFGTFADTAKNTDDEYSFTSNKNIISHRKHIIETFPLPLRHSQIISINGEKRKTIRTELTYAYKKSRLFIHSEAA